MDRRNWLIVLALSLGPSISLAFARFGYGLMLPAMQQDLAWNYTTAGWMNTANAIGYLAGALLALALSQRVGASRMFVGGMILTTVALLGSGFSRELWLLSSWRLLAGIGSAPVFIAGGALASTLFPDEPRKNALAIAIYFGGGGSGLLFTGISIPLILETWGATAWPIGWIILGVGGVLAIIPCIAAISAMNIEQGNRTASASDWRLHIRQVYPVLIGYFLFGLGYFIYMTFLVAWMRNNGNGTQMIIIVWSLLSIAVMFSPFVWSRVLAASDGGAAMALTMAFTATGTLVPLLLSGTIGMLISAILFGLAFVMVPTAATTFSKKNYPQHKWGAAVALFTTLFALGQIIGPAVAGVIADYTGSLSPGIAVGGCALLVGAMVCIAQKPIPRADAS